MSDIPLDWHVRQYIRRGARRSLCWSLLGLAAVAALFACMSDDFRGFFFGPTACDDSELMRLAAHPGAGNLLAYVSLGARPLVNTGMTETIQSGGARGGPPLTIMHPIYLTRVADRWMVVVARDEFIGPRLTGPIVRCSPNIQSRLEAELLSNRPDLRGKILPIMFDDTWSFRVAGYFWLCVLVPAAGLCVFNLARSTVRLIDP